MHRRKEPQVGTPAFKGNGEAHLGRAGRAHVLMVSRESSAREPGAGAPGGGRGGRGGCGDGITFLECRETPATRQDLPNAFKGQQCPPQSSQLRISRKSLLRGARGRGGRIERCLRR